MAPLITQAQNGHAFTMRVGERLTLQLSENPSTGYTWAFASLDETRLEIESSSFSSDSAAVGSGGSETWILRARAPGHTRVELKLLRPWEGETSVIERFAVALGIEARHESVSSAGKRMG